MEDFELDLLKEILWFMSNLADVRSIAFAFTVDRLPSQLYLIARNYHQQFGFDMWRILLWVFRVTVKALVDFEKNQIDIDPVYNFLMNFQEVICGHLLESEHTE